MGDGKPSPILFMMSNVLNLSFDNDTPQVYVRLAALPEALQEQVLAAIGPPPERRAPRDEDVRIGALPKMSATWVAGGDSVPAIVSLRDGQLAIDTYLGVFTKPVIAVTLRQRGVSFIDPGGTQYIFTFNDRPTGLPHPWTGLLPEDVVCRVVPEEAP